MINHVSMPSRNITNAELNSGVIFLTLVNFQYLLYDIFVVASIGFS